MRRNRVAVWCLVPAIVLIVGSNNARSAESKETKQVTCTGKVVDEQGQPIAGVKISLHEMVYDDATYTYDPKLLGQAQTVADGAFSFDETLEDNQYRYGYIVVEKQGFALSFDNWNMRDGDKELQIKLGPSKELTGIVVDENDNPVSDAEVAAMLLFLGEGKEQKHLNSLVVPKLLTTNTDATGKFVFTRIPTGVTAEFIAKKKGKATLSTYKRPEGPYQKLNFSEGQKDIKLLMQVEAKIEGVVVEKSTGKPVGGVEIRCTNEQEAGYFRPQPLASKEDGTFNINALIAARYIVELVQPRDKLPDWVAEPVEVITEAGTTKSGIRIELNKGGVLEVKVIDAVNKEPVEEVYVNARNQVSNRYQNSRSDINGLARMRLMPGDYQINQVHKQGYSRQRLQDTVTIQDGKTERLEYELAGMPKINGVVRDEKDEVLEGVKLKICPTGGRDDVTTDAEGRFEMTYDPGGWGGPQSPIMYLVCRHEERNLAAAVQIEEDNRAVDVKLEHGVMFIGKVVDPNGNGIKGATFYVNLRASDWGSPIGRDFPVTDGQGKFEIQAIPAEHKYGLHAQAEGYGEIRKDVNIEDITNNCFDAGTITLPVANLSVSGVVVDDNNKPVAGARINSYGDNQPYRYTQTDVDGKFTLEKVCAGKIRVSANKSGATRLYGSIETEGGATDIRIAISQRSTSTRYEPRRPPSLVGRPMPELKKVGIDLSPADTDGKMLLVCFFDMEQRPSRHCVMQLVKQAEKLKSKGITVVAIQASKIEQTALNQWKNKYNIPFPVGMVQSDAEKTRFSWGVRSMPWLILTDREHIVQTAGFRINDLDEKIGEK
ncbi:MAG: carboxypeptidase regulatory-like domain-containing protein [Planctomycetota bacterium]|jgi:protocatechuate 3,4-dioxygenase beta subunit